MILLDNYITGPACLRQLFQLYPHEDLLSDFWNQRGCFYKDFSPLNVFYWDDEFIGGYQEVSSFIDLFDEKKGFSREELEHFACALEQFLGVFLDRSILESVIQSSQLDADPLIISFNTPILDLSKIKISTPKTCLRKIEAISNTSSIIKLYGVEHVIPVGQCIYAVASNGKFVLILPRELECKYYKLTLINHPGVFASELKRSGKAAGYTDKVFNNIVSFSIINGKEMIMIDYNGVIDAEEGASKLVVRGFPAIYTISDNNNNNGIVLYKRGNGSSDCLLKTTLPGIKKTAPYAGFNIHGHLIGLNNEI